LTKKYFWLLNNGYCTMQIGQQLSSGCFQMGSTNEDLEEAIQAYGAASASSPCSDAFINEQPSHEVCFETPYWIDVYEVTNAVYGSSSTTTTDNSRGWLAS
jgi:formylglycine-generating enzyme required for sulfatase activity